MKASLLLALLFVGASTLAGAAAPQNPPPAPIYPWCMQAAGPRMADCYYSTIEQCRATASAVGFCHENPAYTVMMQNQKKSRR